MTASQPPLSQFKVVSIYSELCNALITMTTVFYSIINNFNFNFLGFILDGPKVYSVHIVHFKLFIDLSTTKKTKPTIMASLGSDRVCLYVSLCLPMCVCVWRPMFIAIRECRLMSWQRLH